MANRKPATLLTKRELAVMNVIWESGSEFLTIREVVDRMNADQKKKIAYTTVQTLMGILKDKGVLKTKAGSGRAHAYSAKVTREKVRTSMVGDLVDRLFDGQAETLLAGLVEHKSLDREDLQSLKKLIEDQLTEEGDDK